MQILTLIRGLPGAGKSTLAYMIVHSYGSKYRLYEADDYFYDGKGEYKFDGTKLAEAHKQCYDNTRGALQEGADVIVANTFTTLKEMEPYLRLAEEVGAKLQIIEVHSDFKSEHNVPEETMARMRQRWEHVA